MSTEVLNLDLQRIIRLIPGYDPVATAPSGWWFEPDAATAAIAFFPERLKHMEGVLAGERFLLEPWQQAIIANLFGWKRKDDHGRTVRRYRESLIFVARKNGKSPLAAGIALYCLFCDPERGQQNYLAASTREQAGLLFRHCRGMVEQSPAMQERCRVYGGNAPGGQAQSIVRESRSSFLKIISADVSVGKHGKNLNLAIVDELHEQANRDLVDTLRTSMASANKPQPLMIYTTTSDFERPGSVCNEIHEYACKVRDGVIDNPKFLPVIYEATREDDWTLLDTWKKANPNLGVSVSQEFLADECKAAQETPARENVFKRLHLNIRTEQDQRWLSIEKWDACPSDADREDLVGKPCFGGLDLSTTTDLSALVLAFPKDAGGYSLLSWFWVPEENTHAREKKDRVPYTQWIREGWITATPGNVIDYDVIRADINRLGKQYDIREIAVDRWNATQLMVQLAGDGFEIVKFGQGYGDMTSPTKELEGLVLSSRVDHGGNPVLRWMASNVTVEQDAAGNFKPSKAKSTERIDGIVAAVMAIGRAMVTPVSRQSYYETNDPEWFE